jgi:NAD(P)H-dependent flavin oxidoreductase YrpB (nitropropane dioxygenase family)
VIILKFTSHDKYRLFLLFCYSNRGIEHSTLKNKEHTVSKKTFGMIRCGGMGVNISCPRLAKALAMLGQYGTVSGVALERVLVAILQRGDPDGNIRRALATFPFQAIVKEVMEKYFVDGGVKKGRFKNAPSFTINPSGLLIALVVCANYSFVWLAKEGHDHPITINYLEKIAMPHPFAVLGAMLANVDFITMGAGMALLIPEMIVDILEGRPAHYEVLVLGSKSNSHTVLFDFESFFGAKLPTMKKPGFIPVVSSYVAANAFVRLSSRLPKGSISGFGVEENTAAGHNAPPRRPVFDAGGNMLPVYGEKDVIDYARIASLGLPFWIGGNYASPKKLAEALALGAQGVQVGSIFALCEESGMDQRMRRRLRALGFFGKLKTNQDMQVSPTGYPFMVAMLEGTVAETKVFENRERICDHGVLCTPYQKSDGTIGYRCPSGPIDHYVAQGGIREDTEGRKCLCNGLLTTAGMNNEGEPAIVTLGNVDFLRHLMTGPESSYTAENAVRWLLSEQNPTPP